MNEWNSLEDVEARVAENSRKELEDLVLRGTIAGRRLRFAKQYLKKAQAQDKVEARRVNLDLQSRATDAAETQTTLAAKALTRADWSLRVAIVSAIVSIAALLVALR